LASSGEFSCPFAGDSLPFSGFEGDFEIHIYVAFAGVALIALGQTWIWSKIWLSQIQQNLRALGGSMGLAPGTTHLPFDV
jgi:hypothetical protein